MKNFRELFDRIEIDFEIYQKNKTLFLEAFTHCSAVSEQASKTDNERLEFLGDAVLELVVTEYLFKKFKHPEGELTNYRSALVKRENLARVARNLNLGAYLRLSRGEDLSGGRKKDYLLANVMEAFLGALYLSAGILKTQNFIQNFILCELDAILEKGAHIGAKSAFQEFSQGAFGITPVYEVLEEVGKDHEKIFTVGVFLSGVLIEKGTGHSKKEAQTDAANNALEHEKDWEGKFLKK